MYAHFSILARYFFDSLFCSGAYMSIFSAHTCVYACMNTCIKLLLEYWELSDGLSLSGLASSLVKAKRMYTHIQTEYTH